MSKFYVTTAIDYTNDVVHIGHSYQKIVADVLARYSRLVGNETYFLTGTDEHGQKVEAAAKEAGVAPKEFVDKIAAEDKKEWQSLNISFDRFIRTTDEDHVKLAQEFYLKSKAKGDIYLGKYEGLYCEGCERFLVEGDLIDGKCQFHPNKEPKKIVEENYFFKLSKYQKFIEELLRDKKKFVVPDDKRKEVLAFVKAGLEDFSVSRQNVGWGIPVPDHPKHTIYVWFDALINYLTYGLEKNCWPADVHILGKDNQRFHAVYWPAMLKSAGYELPKTILVHDFISLNGQKISKSLGNVIRPTELVKQFDTDAVRYYFLRYGPQNNDVDISLDKLKEAYNADLANGLGNLVARVAKLAELNKIDLGEVKQERPNRALEEIGLLIDKFDISGCLNYIWGWIKGLDEYINKYELWTKKGIEANKRLKEIIVGSETVTSLIEIAEALKPFLPETAEKILKQFAGPGPIKSQPPLFPRLT